MCVCVCVGGGGGGGGGGGVSDIDGLLNPMSTKLSDLIGQHNYHYNTEVD